MMAALFLLGALTAQAPDYDFDLLGEPPPPVEAVDSAALVLRRRMLTLHQGLGIGLSATMLTTMVAGQLNYSDQFGGANTGRYKTTHKIAAYTTVGMFAATGLLGLLAPVPIEKKSEGIDRITLHQLGMLGAAVGMATQVALGVVTASKEGRAAQGGMARAHLIVGYATLACMVEAVAVILF